MTVTVEHPNLAVYQHFLDAFNAGDLDAVATVVDAHFVDHHPGFDVHDLAGYQQALQDARAALALTAVVEEAVAVDDRIVIRCRLTGRHVGPVMGFAPTGRTVSWTSNEIWRVAEGKLVERWAEDDLLGLRAQLSPDDANVALIRKLNDVVNERRYDDMDELFAATFVDNNPAWSVQSLGELKDIIRDAHQALDFTSHHDLIYPAAEGKVVIHITFTGRFTHPFFGQEPTGQTVSWTSIEVYRIENEQIMERWVQADTTGLMRQCNVPLP